MDQFKFYNHLGFNNPYYILRNSSFRVYSSFKEAVENYDNKNKIDYVSIVELLNNSFIFGDRTMIQGIYRTPWLAQPDSTNSRWLFAVPPSHLKKEMLEEDIAIILFQKLCDEIEEYIDKKRNVGILLSGGMDSRMLAGAVDFMIKTKRIQDIEVTGLTWGNEDSRDVVYAKEIASRLGWNWKHYSVNAKQLMNNIYEAADHGCEYSPVHLHGIPQIRDDNRLDVILAASYGDSVGRAEYSGRKVTKLSSINHSIKNISSLIEKNVFRSALTHINEDIIFYHDLFPVKENYMRNELDYELHYMRRMLNPCMELLINNGTKFYQVFTHPKVYGFMWSIDPKKRNDMVYKYMLNEFKTNLSDIPWSRTGLPYGTNKGTPDSHTKKHHSYIEMINSDLFEELKRIIFAGNIAKLGIFDMSNIILLMKLMSKYPINNLFYSEKIIWLASFSIFLEKFNLTFDTSNLGKLLSLPKFNNFSVFTDYMKNRSKYYIYNKLKS